MSGLLQRGREAQAETCRKWIAGAESDLRSFHAGRAMAFRVNAIPFSVDTSGIFAVRPVASRSGEKLLALSAVTFLAGLFLWGAAR